MSEPSRRWGRSSIQTEKARIVRMYEQYALSPRYVSRHDSAGRGTRMMLLERDAALARFLRTDLLSTGPRILDVGCGKGTTLAAIRGWGAQEDLLQGIDIVESRLAEARRLHPGIRFDCMDAANLPFPDGFFDVVVLFTVFSSIMERGMRRTVASTLSRILDARGSIFWYDARYPNPMNPHTRRVTMRDVRSLFPEFEIDLRPITLLPPLARHLGPLTETWYGKLSRIRVLRSHYMGTLRKPASG